MTARSLPNIPNLLKQKTSDAMAWDITGKNSIYMHKLVKYLSKSTDADRKLLLALAQRYRGNAVAGSPRLHKRNGPRLRHGPLVCWAETNYFLFADFLASAGMLSFSRVQ
jgi:hypothetical protein